MKKAIHQLVPNLRGGDAIGNTALRMREALLKMGYESTMFVEDASPGLRGITEPVSSYLKSSSADSTLLFHYSMGSEAGRLVYNLPDKVVMIYHNITPPEYFLHIHDHVVGELYHGRKQLEQFKDRVVLAAGDSEFNRCELEELGFKNTMVLPLAIDFDSLDQKPDECTRRAFNDHKLNFLFVGRMVPNKGIEDLIKLYAHYKKYVSYDSRLIIVGDWRGFEKYQLQLLNLINTIDLPDVIMTGRVDFSQLLAYYSTADAYISMSRHEGFCVPLLEAMHFDIPVMARATAAVPETMGGAGVLVEEMNYAEMAEMLDLMTSEGLFRQRLLEGQRLRLARYREQTVEESLMLLLERAGIKQ